MRTPVRVAVTGAAGQIAYSLLFRLINGEVFGPDTPVSLQLLELEEAMAPLEGVAMELTDTGAPLLAGIEFTSDPARCFRGASEIFLVGSRPRTRDMQRADLIRVNGPIFRAQGRAIAAEAAADVRILVIGNPVNTNCLVAMACGADVPAHRWSAMTRLDQNRACGMLAEKAQAAPGAVSRLAVWGNHSAAQFPDYANARIHGTPALDVIGDAAWFRDTFLPRARQRGTEVIAKRGRSSAASAAHAALDHVRDRREGASFVSMAVRSDGAYDVPAGIVFSFPVCCPGGGDWELVEGLALDPFARTQIERNVSELLAEKEAVRDLLPREVMPC